MPNAVHIISKATNASRIIKKWIMSHADITAHSQEVSLAFVLSHLVSFKAAVVDSKCTHICIAIIARWNDQFIASGV
jgi:hypothetical protein